ncbi:hypothetical protein [Anaerococcus sp. Marseille-Q7828]|uniref:hypothetical protein n=1 Tax=Anaerococcus sp. Marseille-Q7828 TaxID=3036300 RepID=UPI0024AE1B6E|nr:hypothetical protein [Anaerococcus sp. Marseille-Q7828]
MIYTKNASFPYPILSLDNDSYIDNTIELDIENIERIDNNYIINYSTLINSQFIKNLLIDRKAAMILVISETDSKIFEINNNEGSITIPSSRINLNNKFDAQLQIHAKENISFLLCDELNDFYTNFKGMIEAERYAILGYSNLVTMEAISNNPIDLFEYDIDENLDEDFRIKIDSNSETILLVFNNKRIMFDNQFSSHSLLNMYYYIGLCRAFEYLIDQTLLDVYNDNEEGIFVRDIDRDNVLFNKLAILLEDKNIDYIKKEDIDKVIYCLSPNLIGNFVKEVGVLIGED